MTVSPINIDLNQENIKNVFVDSFGVYILVSTQNNIIGNNFKFPFYKDLQFPICRIIDLEKLLIIDDNPKLNENAFLVNYSGKVLTKFYAGISIEDVIILKNKIIISYFDEGILGKCGPNNDGISIFNFDGIQTYGYKSSVLNDEFIDCYCMTNYGNNRIIFYGYSDFKLKELNLDSFKITEYETPIDFLGANSISTKNEQIILHSSYKDKTSFFNWNLKSNRVQRIDSTEKNLKGTDNGTFFNYNKKSITLFKPIE